MSFHRLRKKMKLSKTRSCVFCKLPPAPSGKKNGISKRRVPCPLLQVNNLQGRRFHSTLDVKIEDCTTVGDLKKSIAFQKNLSVITLLYRGVPLDDARQLEKLLPDLRIGPPRFAAHTRRRPRAMKGGVSVNILTLNRTTFQVILHSLDSTLQELKEAIKDFEGMSLDQIALTYAGKQLTNDHYTLREYKVEPGSTVHLVGRLLGGGRRIDIAPNSPVPVGFVDLENTSLLCKIRLNPRIAPVWRACKEGLNVEGECWNEGCIAFRQMVICPLQFTAFNFDEEVHCPGCNVAIQAVTCGFWRCMWMFEGRKAGARCIDMQGQWMKAGNKYYERFDEGAERATAEWASLVITTKKLPSTRNMKAFHGNGECPICYEDFTASSSQCTVPRCQHSFHRDCLREWQTGGNTTCPMCRDSLE